MSLQTLESVFTIGIIADIVIVAILLINAISGAKKGFVYTIYRFFRLMTRGMGEKRKRKNAKQNQENGKSLHAGHSN